MARSVESLAQSAAAGAFGALAVLRGGRSLHPVGVALRGELAIAPEPPGLRSAVLFRRERTLPAIVRLSRSVGLPEGVPDLYGAALRVVDAYGPDRHQDLMLVTGGEGALARHLFSPAADYRGRTMSTILPYRVGGRLLVFLLRADAASRPLRTVAEIERAARADGVSLTLSVAPGLGGRPVKLARLHAREVLAPAEQQELRFNTDHTGGGLEPALFPNSLRPAAYRASQAARRLQDPEDVQSPAHV